MMALLSSPMGPAMRFDIFDQPNSPTRRHEDLPPDFDRSFGSSMSLGSSFDHLPRASSQKGGSDVRSISSSTSSGLEHVHVDLPISSSSSSQGIHAASRQTPSFQNANSFALSPTGSSSSLASSSSPSIHPRSKSQRPALPALTSSPASSNLLAPSRSPTNGRALGAAMGTTLNSKSPGLAAKMSSPHYMDCSPAHPLPSSSGPALSSSTPASALFRQGNLPPGSAMKEDTPPMSAARRRVSSRPTSRNGSCSSSSGARASLEASSSACAGTKLGRLFGTNMSLNALNSVNPDDGRDISSESSPDGDASYEKEQPPAKRRPSSLPLGEGRPSVRPGLRTATISGASANRKIPSLLNTFRDDLPRQSSIDALGRSQSPVPLQQQERRNVRSVQGSSSNDVGDKDTTASLSFAQSIRERQEAMGLSASAFVAHATIIESPSPGTLERQDLGSYFFDPQSPEVRLSANASFEHASFGEAGSPMAGFGVPRTTSGNLAVPLQQTRRPSSLNRDGESHQRAFVKAHSSAILPTKATLGQEAAQSRSLLGKRLNPYHWNRHPSTLIQEQRRCHKSAQAVLGVAETSAEAQGTLRFPRLTAPAPRRCHSSFEPFAASGGLMEPMHLSEDSTANPCVMLDSTSSESIDMMASSDGPSDSRFPDGFDANGSPVAPSLKSRGARRPTFGRQSSKDDVSPLGYGSRRQRERTGLGGVQEGDSSPMDGEGKMSSPFGASEGMPGFGASERSGKVLPCFNVKEDGLMRITPQTLIALMQGQYNDQIESYQVVDCRFGYEHQGGHIPGAINLSTVDRVKNYFLTKDNSTSPRGRELPPRSQSGRSDCFGNMRKPILVFHCEFSAKRAPSMALALRQADRSLASDYPNCHYPEVYILQGGYCGFFKEYEEVCEPRAYVRMDDPAHLQMRSTELNGFRKQFLRHRSFTYGDTKGSTAAATEGSDRPTSFCHVGGGGSQLGSGMLGLSGNHRHDPKRRSALGQIVDGPNQSIVSEEESSFETDSPSNLAAASKKQLAGGLTAGGGGGGLVLDLGNAGDTSFESNDSFELNGSPVLLLRGSLSGAANDTGNVTGQGAPSASGNNRGSGLGDSPCAAAGHRRSAAGSAMLLGVQNSSSATSTSSGAPPPRPPPRRAFVRAGTTGGLFAGR